MKERRSPQGKEDTRRQICSSSISSTDLTEKEDKKEERWRLLRSGLSAVNTEDGVRLHMKERRSYDSNNSGLKDPRKEEKEDILIRCGRDRHQVSRAKENRERKIDAPARCPCKHFFFFCLSPLQLSASPYRSSSQSFFSPPRVEKRDNRYKHREEEEKNTKKDRREQSNDVLRRPRNDEERDNKDRGGEDEEKRRGRRSLLSIAVPSPKRRGEKSDRSHQTSSFQRISSSPSLPFSSFSSFSLFLWLSTLFLSLLLLLRGRSSLLGTIDSEHRLSSETESEREGRGEGEEEKKDGEEEQGEKKEVLVRERKEIIRSEGTNGLNNSRAAEKSFYSIQ